MTEYGALAMLSPKAYAIPGQRERAEEMVRYALKQKGCAEVELTTRKEHGYYYKGEWVTYTHYQITGIGEAP